MAASLIDVARLKLRSDVAVHRQVAAYFKAVIALRQLSPGQSLPGVSVLAEQIGAPAAEVRQGYAELEKRGFAVSEGGKWRVCEDRAALSDEIGDRLSEIISDARRAGLSRAEIERLFESLISRP